MNIFFSNIKRVVRIFFVLLLAVVTIAVLGGNEPWLLSTVNFVFHEAGHPVFGVFFGEVMGFFGGTCMQLLVPLTFAFYFFAQKDIFSSCVMFWWAGENMMGIARYISDARSMQLELWGGGRHDWNFLLAHFGILQWDTLIGNGVRLLGFVTMILALVGAGVFLYGNKREKIRNENAHV